MTTTAVLQPMPQIPMRLASGEPVSIKRKLFITPEALMYLPDALYRIESQGEDIVRRELEHPDIIGHSLCVPTTERDEIVYAMRPKRLGYSRFVLNRDPLPSNVLRVILLKINQEPLVGTYKVISCYVGKASEPEPWDSNATPQSIPFWKTHALIYGQMPIIPRSETNKIPRNYYMEPL